MTASQKWNAARFVVGSPDGHYESWFQRANDPTGRRALWIRYTIFSPIDRPQDAVGELWAISFDRKTNQVVAVKDVVPIDECRFSRTNLDVIVGAATLEDGKLKGEASANGHTIAWDLTYHGGQSPLLLLPERMYDLPLPRAKLVVGHPNVWFGGTFTVDGTAIKVDDWLGSQNHNWGSRHTDRYAWGQVCGFDEDQDAFLECSTARLKLGPLWSPWMSPLVLRRRGYEPLMLNGLPTAIRAEGTYDIAARTWSIVSKGVRVEISAPPEHFVALRYGNPPGGSKTCLNTKIARCVVTLPTGEKLTSNRAAFEILEDHVDGVEPEV